MWSSTKNVIIRFFMKWIIYWPWVLLAFTISLCCLVPMFVPREVAGYGVHGPTWQYGLLFGTYYDTNLL